MKHKIRIDSLLFPFGYLWYAACLSGECPSLTRELAPSVKAGGVLHGRDTWEAAFALGVAHQRNADLKERLKA